MSFGKILAWITFAACGPTVAALPIPLIIKSLLAQATFSALFALGVGLLIKQNGMISFGHAAFFGLPGYMLGVLLPFQVLPVELLICAALLLSGGIAFVLGLIFVRAQGIAFGMLTLAIGQAVYEAATRMRWLSGGNDGLTLKLPAKIFGLSLKVLQQPSGMLVVSWLVMATTLGMVCVLASSRFGRLTEAIRDNEERARFLGYRTLWPRAAVFALSAVVTSIGGVMFAVYSGFVSPDTVHWTASGSALIMAILGGSGASWGPVAGALVYFFLKESLDSITTHWLSIIGIALIVITVAFPTGIAGLVPLSRHVIAKHRREARLARA
jgi:branched-chain amino acid transport system permease protein